MDSERPPGQDGSGPGKRLILLLDGTWNNWEAGDNDTNIVRLEDLIIRYLEREADETSTGESTGENSKVRAYRVAGGPDNYVFYQRGVGTGFSDRFSGGIFGEGLSDNIRRAYKFLSFNYESGDQIFVFGFSRGAYTARSIIGYIAAAGLLKREACSLENEEAAWNYYRTSPADRLPADWVALTPHVHTRKELRVECVGVFDTVGALGIPLGFFRTKNREKYAFHDVNLSSITNVNLHAMAIDEHREPFRATIWRRPRFKTYDSKTEQVWFPGVHADIGGGYIPASQRYTGGYLALDDITLNWMVRRVKANYPRFPISLDDLPAVDEDTALADQHNSRSLTYKLFRFALRTIANLPIGRYGLWETIVSYDRRDEAINERVHISALLRLGQRIRVDDWKQAFYQPRNLLGVLSRIEETYSGGLRNNGSRDRRDVHIVDWKGEMIDESECDRALAIVKAARDRLDRM